MLLNEETRDDSLILRPVGRLDNSGAPALERVVVERIEAGATRIVFDFSDMDYISSAGLRVVLIAGKRLRSNGGKVALAGMRELVREVFEISGFIGLFPSAATVEEALRRLKGAPA